MTTIPIWVTDPTGNNNPFLIIVSSVFAVSQDALYGDPSFGHPTPVTRNARFWQSVDGISWNLATCDADDIYPTGTFGGLYGPNMDYGNGTWMTKLFFDNLDTEQEELGLFVISYDGKTWTTVFTETPMIGGNRGSNHTFEYDNNRWRITYNSGTGASPVISNFYVANPNPQESGTDPDDPRQADFMVNFTILADKSQTAAPMDKTAINPLPSGFTAIRYNDDNPTPDTFEYTKTPVTADVVNSGDDWPAATWVETFDNSTDVSNQNVNRIAFGKAGISPS